MPADGSILFSVDDELTLDERTNIMRPRLVRLDAEVLCLQNPEQLLRMIGYY